MLGILAGICIGIVIGFMYCIKENEKINKDYIEKVKDNKRI